MDPDTKRFSLINKNVHSILSVYKQIYNENKKQNKQTTMDIFLTLGQLLMKTSCKFFRKYLTKGIVIIAHGRPIHLTIPEGLLVGQDMGVEDRDVADPDPVQLLCGSVS